MTGPPASFFEKFRAAFDCACAATGRSTEVRIGAGGVIFRLRFATVEIQKLLLPALSHLAPPPESGQPDDFVIEIWDSKTTGVQPPPTPWNWSTATSKGEIPGLNDPRLFGHLSHASGAVSLFHPETATALFWLADASALRGYERAAPMLPIFQWCLQRGNRHIAHAAVAGIDSGAALFAGRGGSGKSTTAALAHAGGLLHLGDDYCLLGDDPLRAFTFYRSMKLNPNSLTLPPLASHRHKTAWISEDKNVLLLPDDRPRELRLKLILLPNVTSQSATTVRPAGAADALRALAPSSLFQLPGSTAQTFAFFARLARQLPAYHLDLGSDAENVATRVRELLENTAP